LCVVRHRFSEDSGNFQGVPKDFQDRALRL
jgi:hypothetical protein